VIRILLLGGLLLGATAPLLAQTKSGEASFRDANTHIKVTVGEGVKYETDFHRFEFGGKASLAANGTLKNTTTKKRYVALYVAFFDKDKNLLGSSGRTTILEPGKDLLAAYVVEMPAEQIDQVTSYQITLYESEKEIGAK
jgi:hypothetical protein